MHTKNPYTDPNSEIIQKICKKYPNGFSAKGLARTIQIESSGNPKAVSPGGGHVGLGQVGAKVFEQYGPPGGHILDPVDNLMATANLANRNAGYLLYLLGRWPTDAELYLAHQQGAEGASKLLKNPNARAGDIINPANIKANRGNPEAPAKDFSNMWIQKFLTVSK